MAIPANTVSLLTIYDEIGRFFGSAPTVEQITEFTLSETADRYLSELLEANRTRGLSPDERETLDEYAVIEHLVQFIKIQAFANLEAK